MSEIRIALELLQNIAVLMLLAFVVSHIYNGFPKPLKPSDQLSLGLIFGFTAYIGMLIPVQFSHGVIIDGRVIIIALAGFFGGATVALTAGMLTCIYRFFIGGAGTIAGFSEILFAMLIGIIFYRFGKNKQKLHRHLILIGILITCGSMVSALALPPEIMIKALKSYSLPVIIFYPIGTYFIGLLFAMEGRRMEIHTKLQENEKTYSDMLENLNEGFFNVLVDGTFLNHNYAFNRILGFDENKNLKGLKSLNLWADSKKRQHYLDELFKNGKVNDYVVDVKKQDGSIAIVKMNARLIKDEKGNPVRIEGTILDITEQRKTALSLIESEEFLKTAYKAAENVSFISTDLAGEDSIILDFSPGAEKIFGYKKEEVINKPVAILHPSEVVKEFPSMQDAMRKGGKFSTAEAVLVRKSGEEFPALFTVYPRLDSKGKVIGALGVALDISSEKDMELKLRHSEKMEAIGQLAGGVAHDFNNMLGVIKGYADMLVHSLDEDEFIEYAKNINKAADRSATLTNQLLAFARKGQYKQSIVDIHQIINETISMLEHTVSKNININQILKANPSSIKGDSSQILNSLLNLAINASDAMPDGGQLTFSTTVLALDAQYCQQNFGELFPGEYLEVTVSDTGTGITQELQGHIFEPFFTTKPRGKGTGMGLAAVYGIIKNHNGNITVESTPGKGTTFKIHFPISVETTEEEKTIPAPSKKSTGNKIKIMLVDDEKLFRNLAKDLLKKLNYKMKICQNGKEAVEYYNKSWKQVDLVVLDMVMPGLSGKETFIALRKINPNIKALLASGYSIDGEAQEILEEGVLGFVHKPFTIQELEKAITDVLAEV